MSQDDAHAQEEDFIAQRIAEDQGWVRVQTRTFTRWVNENLKTTEHKVENLDSDFGDGLKLVGLLQQLAGKSIGARVTKRPRIRAQKLENVKLCFDFMNREGIEMVNIDNQDVADGNMKLILGMVWHLILHYQIATGFDDDGGKGGPKNRIIKWVNSKINPWGQGINNLGPDWNNGTILACLVNALAPGLVPDFAEMKPEDARDNIDRAMENAKEWMDIPRVLEPEDMMDPNLKPDEAPVDELSMMTYLSYFPNAKVKDGAPCVNPGRVIARGPGITGVGLKLGKPAEFEIDASKAGENGRDKIKVEVTGPEGPVKVDLTSNGDLTYTGAYYPEDDGEYHVKITLLNCPIPKSPFKIGIFGAQKTDPNKVKVTGPGVTGEGILPGDPAPFVIDYKEAGRGQPKVEVFGPDHQPLTIVEDNDKKESVCKVEYQPAVFGEYTVTIKYGGLPLPNSPYKVNIKPTVDIGKVKTEGPGLSRCKVDEPTWFKVHTAGAGKGDLAIKILQTDGTELEPKITDDGKGTFHVEYTPKMVGSYKVTITYGRCKLPKSPFTVTVVPPGDAGEVIVNGDALHGIRVGMTGKLFVDASKAGKGDLKVNIIGPDNKPITTGLELVKCVDGVSEYGFTPEVPGPHIIAVYFSGHPVPGSPFDVTVKPSLDIERIKLIVDRDNPPRINKPYKFTVDCSKAGPGPVLFGFLGDPENDNPDKPRKDILVVVCDDKGNPIKDKKGKPIVVDVKENKSAGIAHFTFTPVMEGPIYLKVTYDGKDVPKSPLMVTVSSYIDMSKVKIYGDGITTDKPVRANKPMTFVIDATNAGAGPISLDYLSKMGFTIGKDNVPKDMKITIIGPNGEPMKCDVKKRNDKVFEVTLLPELVGQLNIDLVGASGEHAPKSPLKIQVKPSVDASKIVIGGDGIEKDKVPRKDKLCALTVDAEKAGTAPFSISVNGKDKTPEGSGAKKPLKATLGKGAPGKGRPGDKPGDKPGEEEKAPGADKPGFGPDGKPTPGTFIAPDGTIKDDKNKPVKGKDGKPLKCALGDGGNPNAPKTDDKGNLVGDDGKPLVGSDGYPVKPGAGPDGPTAGPDGTLFGTDGKPLLDKDGKPLKAGQMHDGKPLCNDEGEILGPDGKPVTGPDGEPTKANKKPLGLSVQPDGSLLTPSGKPLCGPDGNPLKCGFDNDKKPLIDEKGALCGPEGKPLVGPDGKGIKPGAGSLGPNVKPDGSITDGSGKPLLGKDGKPLKAAMGSSGKPKVNDKGDIVGSDGKPLLLPVKKGKGPGTPCIGPDGSLCGPDGRPLTGDDGKPLRAAVGPDGKPKTDDSGNLLGSDDAPITGTDGKPVKLGSGPCGPKVGPDGTVYGPDGKPLVGADDKPLTAKLGPSGKPVSDPYGNLVGKDDKPLTDKSGKLVNPAADGPHVGPDGSVHGPDGRPLKGTDGKPLKAAVGSDGKPKTDDSGNILGTDDKPVKGSDGQPVKGPNGTPIKAPDAYPGPHIGDDGSVTKTDGTPLLGSDGKPLKTAPAGKPQTDKDGNLVGPDGKPLVGSDGKPVGSSGGPYGPLVTPDGDLEGPGGLPVIGPESVPLVCEQNPEGIPSKDGEGNLIGPDGLPLIGPDDKPVLFGKDTAEDTKPDEQPSDINVVILGPDDKPVPATVKDLGDGKFAVQYEPKEEGPHKLDVLAGGEHAPKCPVEVDVKPALDLDKLACGIGGGPSVGPDGTPFDANGKPLKDKNGKPLKCALGPMGQPKTDKDGNLVGPDGKPLVGEDGKPVKGPGKDDDKAKTGKGLDLKINPKDLGVDKLNIKPKGPGDGDNPPGPACGPYIGKDGQVHTPTGDPLRGQDGKPLKAALGGDGKPVTDKDNNLLGPDGVPLIAPDGNPTKLGSGPYGPAVGPDGTPYGKDGKPLVGPDGKPQKGDIGPKGKPLVDSEGNLLNPAGQPVTDKDGKPFTPGAGPHIGPDGTVYDDDGEPLVGTDGKQAPKAAMTPEGTPKYDKDGNVLGSDGKPLKGKDGKPLKTGTGPYAKPDGEVFNSDGSPSKNPNGEPNKAAVGEDGKPVTDAKGNLVGPDAKPIKGPDGKPVRPNPNGPAGPSVTSMKPDGTMLGPNGKPLKGADGKPLQAALGNDGKPKKDPNGNMVGKDGKPLVGPNGKPIKPGQGEYGPRVGPDGTVFKPNGDPVTGPSGKPNKAGIGPDGRPMVNDNGNILGPDGLPLSTRDGKPVPASENPYVGPDGTVYKPDGTPIGGGKGGKPLTADTDKNGNPKTDKDGNLLGPDGKPLRGPDEKLLKNGMKPYVSPDGNVMLPNGKPLTGNDKKPLKAGLGGDGKPDLDDKNCIMNPTGQNVKGKDGKPVPTSPNGPKGPGPGAYIGPDGTLHGADGNPLIGPDGKPLKSALGPDGKPKTDKDGKDGNLLGPDGKPLIGPDGKPVKPGQGPYGPGVGPDGTVFGPDGKPVLGKDGKPVKAGLGSTGKPLCDENGVLLGPDGKPLSDKNGKPVNPRDDTAYVGPDGTVYGPDGKPLLGPDGKPLKSMLGPDGRPMTDKDGNLLGPDGKPLKGPDGKPVELGPGPVVSCPDGIVYSPNDKPMLGPDGKPLIAALGPDGKPLKDKNGNLIGPDGKPLLGPDGKPIQATPNGPDGSGSGPYAGSDGTLYGPDGKPLLGPDGKPLKAGLNPDGSLMLDKDGNILGPDGKPLIGPDGKPIKPGSGFGPSVGPDGTVYGPDGKPLLGPDGKPVKALLGNPKTDKDGNLLGPDGKPLLDKNGNPVSGDGKPFIGPDGTLYGPDGQPLLGPDGKPLKCGLDENGNPLFDKDGNLLGPDGKPLLGPDGKPFNKGAIGPDGKLYGPDGKPLLDKDGNPLRAGLGAPKKDKDGNLIGEDGNPLVDADGNPIKPGALPYVGPDGTVYGPDGKPLLGPDGKPLKAGLGPDGKPLYDENGNLLGPDGKPLLGPDGKPIKTGMGPHVGPDGTVYGPDGKPVLGPDGLPLKALMTPDGKPFTDADGNLLGPDGRPLLGPDGKPINPKSGDQGPKVGPDGTVYGPDGKPLLGPDGKPLKAGLGPDGKPKLGPNGELLGPDGKPLVGADGKPVKVGNGPAVGPDGTVFGPDGKPLLGPDGKPLKANLGPDGKPITDKDGNMVGPDGKPLVAADGNPVGSGKPKSGGPLVGPDGSLLGADGKPKLGPDGKPIKTGLGKDGKPLTDANGNLLGPDGKPLLGPDGKPVEAGNSCGPDGSLYGPDGKPLLGPDGKPLKAGFGPDGYPTTDPQNGNILGPDGSPVIGSDGKPIKAGIPSNGPMVGPDGTLLGPDGKPILGSDGKPLKAALGPDGLPIVDQDGNLLGPGGKPLTGPCGNPIHAGPCIGPDGVVRGPDGWPIAGKDGKPQAVMMDEFGKPMCAPDGTLMGADGLPIIGDDGKPINDHCIPPNGPPTGPDGTVYGPDGKPLLGPDGKPLKAGLGPDGLPKTDKDGNLLGPDGKPLKGPNGQPVKAGPCIGPDGVVRHPDGTVVKGLDGQPLKAAVGPDNKLMVGPDGTPLGPDGKPLCGPDGKPMKPGSGIGPDGTLLGPDGQPLLGPDGKPLKCGMGPDGKPLLGPDGALLGPDGKPLVGPDGNLIGADGKPLLGPDGRPVRPGTTVGPDGTVLGPDGKPVLGPDGKPLKAGLGPDGKPLRGPGGELLDEDGNPLVDENGNPVKPGTTIGPDGTVLGPDGKALIGPDGKPLKAGLGPDGKPLVGPDGSLLGPDGKPLLGPDGKPVGPGNDRTHATGLGPDGKPLGPLGADGRPLPVEEGGDMTVMCVGPDGDLVPVDIIENPDGTYSVKAAPGVEGDYVADIIGPDGKKLASIPFHVEPQIDASKVKLGGDSIDGVVKKDKPTSFEIDTSEAGKGPFTASPYEPDTVKNGGIPGIGDKDGPKSPDEEDTDIKVAVIGPNGEPVDCTVVDKGDGKFDVQYKPTKEGPHKVVVLANDDLVPGVPVPVQVFPNGDASKCKASGPGIEPKGLMAGKPGTFKVDATRAGDGDVEVLVTSPNPKLDPNVKVTKRGKGLFDCSYNPSLKGPYEVKVLFAGEEIPGSIFNVTVSPNPNAEKIVVSGKGLKKGYAKKPNKFTVAPNGAEGALNFDVEGPSKCDIDVEDNGDGTVTVTYTPQEAGEYTINVTLDGAQAPGGPFFPLIEEAQPSDASKVKLSGDGIGNNVKTGVPATIKIDASEAGPGDVDVNIKSPSGSKIPVDIVDNEDGTYDVTFTPDEVGNHNIDVKFDKDKVPGAPLTVPVKPGIDANKVKCGGDGLDNPKAKHDNVFTIDTSAAGPGDDVQVEIVPVDKAGKPIPGGKKVPVTIKDLGNGVKSCVFNPDEEGPYLVDLKFCGKNPKDFPRPIKVKGPGAAGARLPNINGLELEPDQEINIPVDLSASGPGDFVVIMKNDTTGEEEPVRVTDGPNLIKNVTLKPNGSGPHTITMLFDEEDLPGGPYTVTVKKPVGADACSMKPAKDGKLLTLDGDLLTFVIDLSQAGPGNLTGIAKTPSGKMVPIDVEVDKDTGLAHIKFKPTEKGIHLINLLFNGHPIPGCPFELDIQGPADVKMNGGKPKDGSGSVCLDLDDKSLVVVPNMVNVKVIQGQDMKIPIDLTFSGDGMIEVTCIHDATLEHVPCKLVDTPNGKELQVSPKQPGWYTVHMKFNGENLPGSPYKFEVKEPTGADACKIKKGPKSPLKEGEEITLIIDVSKAGEGQLLGTCKGPDSSNVPVKTKKLDNGDIEVSFKPKADGDHTLDLTFNNRSIPGCPAIINVRHVTPDSIGLVLDLAPWEVDAGAKGAKGVRHPNFDDVIVQLNQTMKIPLDLSAAGPGNIEVSCMQEKTKQPCPVTVVPTKQGAVEIAIKPLETGPHLLHITFNGVDLPKSPFRFMVEPPSGANAVTLKKTANSVKVVKDGVQFAIDCSRAGPGVLTAACTGPDGQLVPCECKKSGSDQLITIKPTKPGLHSLEVMWDGQQIPGSPIEIMIDMVDGRIIYELCDVLLMLMGAFTVRTPDLSNIQLEINQFIRIPIDCRLAGPGKLQVTCKNEDTGTSIDCDMKKTGDMYEITIKPTDPGKHALNIMWDGKHIPGSPAYFTVKGPAPARLCYILSGADHIKCSKGSISFRCTTKEAGKGELTALGVDPFGKQFECEITEEPDLTYAIAFKPEVPGVHNVDVKYNGLSINGSPALIDIKSLPQGDEGGISLELISCRDTTSSGSGTDTQVQQKATITLPIPKKDHSGLTVSCKGPDGSDIKCELGASSDAGINVLFEPSSGGKHTLTVTLNGKNYPGTPVDVEVQGL